MDRRRILVIAGSDSSGGAGLEADQRVIASHKCYAMTATTALTAQNTLGVSGIHYTPPAFVRQQIEACLDDIGVDVVKTGMLASAETIEVVADALEKYKRPVSVIDPVMLATSGAQLLPQAAVRSLRLRLLPLTTVLTPNIPEARLLLQDTNNVETEETPIRSITDIVTLTQNLQLLGPDYVLTKGGHVPLTKDLTAATTEAERHRVVNVLCSKDQTIVFHTDYQNSKNTHGTGCSLASAIACNLATGHSVADSVELACRYVEAGIRLAPNLGKGSGPINHFHAMELTESSMLKENWTPREQSS